MTTKKKKDNRGGARPNSGPKPQTVSTTQLQEMRDAATAKAEATGKSLFDVCLDWIYDPDIKIDRQQAAWKLYTDKMLIKISEGGEADQVLGPAVFLPERHPRLELVDDSVSPSDKQSA